MRTEETNYGGSETRVAGGQQQVYADDGRLKMARDLERVWPHIVEVRRRFDRPQHKIAFNWGRFDTKLIRRKDIDWDSIPLIDELGLKLKAISDPKSSEMRKLLEDYEMK